MQPLTRLEMLHAQNEISERNLCDSLNRYRDFVDYKPISMERDRETKIDAAINRI